MIQNSCQWEFAVVGIGSSARCPTALERLSGAFPGRLPARYVLSQQIPHGFTGPLAERLSSISNLRAIEASHGHMTKIARALIAPGVCNMKVVRDRMLRVERAPDGAHLTPSINVMKSIAHANAPESVGPPSTGMLQEGMEIALARPPADE